MRLNFLISLYAVKTVITIQAIHNPVVQYLETDVVITRGIPPTATQIPLIIQAVVLMENTIVAILTLSVILLESSVGNDFEHIPIPSEIQQEL
ncbi:MAG: hypothetical protein HZA08_00645 [Nitrospirae bacterium]|nr:hypothetical protein [Nitrospirota bacterium]